MTMVLGPSKAVLAGEIRQGRRTARGRRGPGRGPQSAAARERSAAPDREAAPRRRPPRRASPPGRARRRGDRAGCGRRRRRRERARRGRGRRRRASPLRTRPPATTASRSARAGRRGDRRRRRRVRGRGRVRRRAGPGALAALARPAEARTGARRAAPCSGGALRIRGQDGREASRTLGHRGAQPSSRRALAFDAPRRRHRAGRHRAGDQPREPQRDRSGAGAPSASARTRTQSRWAMGSSSVTL